MWNVKVTIWITLFMALGFYRTTLADELHVPLPYSTIQAAIDDSNHGDVIIVSDGTYTGTGNKNLDFAGKAITIRSENGPEVTIIDCENDGRAVFFSGGEDRSTILEGFTIINGKPERSPGDGGYGGGIVCVGSSPTIMNCIFRQNIGFGGGAICASQLSSPKIIHCVFLENVADEKTTNDGDGGAMNNHGGSSPEIINCLFIKNVATGQGGGGAIRNYIDSSPTIANCTFVYNTAGYGGAINNYPTCSPEIANCIFWGNISPRGHQIHNRDNSHPVISYCNIQGGWNGSGVRNDGGSTVIDGGGNIDANPLFVSGPLGDYYLRQIAAGQADDSPCVNTGSEPAIDLGLELFCTRTDEIADEGIVDIGFHYPGILPTPIQMAIRAILSAIEEKQLILEDLEYTIQKEQSAMDAIDEALETGEYEGLTKGDLKKAKQKINSAIQHQIQSKHQIEQAIKKLHQCYDALGYEQ